MSGPFKVTVEDNVNELVATPNTVIIAPVFAIVTGPAHEKVLALENNAPRPVYALALLAPDPLNVSKPGDVYANAVVPFKNNWLFRFTVILAEALLLPLVAPVSSKIPLLVP